MSLPTSCKVGALKAFGFGMAYPLRAAYEVTVAFEAGRTELESVILADLNAAGAAYETTPINKLAVRLGMFATAASIPVAILVLKFDPRLLGY